MYYGGAMAKKKKKTKAGKKNDDGSILVSKNRRAYYNFEVLEDVEAGICLLGTEVKSLRDGLINLSDGYARFQGGALYLVNVHITEYKQGTHTNHEPTRPRKLLLHKRELIKLQKRIKEKGLTVVPLAVYFNKRGICKVKIGVCRGKQLHDKRRSIAERESKRQLARAQKQDD